MNDTVKHTPGPWVVTGVSMTTGNVSVGMKEHRIVIAEVTNAASFGDMLAGAMKRGGGGFDQADCHTQYANARLIAAAPEVLEALKGLLSDIEEYQEINKLGGKDNHWQVISRAAIAKAEGRS